jgi:hypothetical protein
VAKAGRRLEPHVVDGYNRKNLSAFLERNLRNLETDTIDLLQLLNHIRSLLLKEKCSIRFELGILFVSETRCRFLARNGYDLVTRFLDGVGCDTVL